MVKRSRRRISENSIELGSLEWFVLLVVKRNYRGFTEIWYKFFILIKNLFRKREKSE